MTASSGVGNVLLGRAVVGRQQVFMFSRNLLILQSTWVQDPSDWIAIQQRIERNAPDIEVRIADNGHRNSVTARWQVRRPSLLSHHSDCLILFLVEALYFVVIFRQRRTTAAAIFSWDLNATDSNFFNRSLFDPNEWGDFVIVKPNNLNSGKGVRLVRTADVSAHCDELAGLSMIVFSSNRSLITLRMVIQLNSGS